jgi:DNA-binding transcriptional MerR regulator
VTTAEIEPQARLLRIGETSRASGLTPRAIRLYEDLGLLKPATHVSGGNRRYDADDIERLQLIRCLRESVGLSLAQIQTYLETEELTRALRAQYLATADPATQLAVLVEAEPVLERRVQVLEQRIASVQAVLEQERARLARNRELQAERRAQVSGVSAPPTA